VPNRIIKESICTSETIEQLTPFEETFFYRLIVNCDDYGRFDARIPILKSRLFPLKSVSDKQIGEALKKLSEVGILYIYEYEGKPYIQLSTWDRHQQIRAKKSKYPEYDESCMQLISDDSKCPRNPIRIQSESNPNPNPIYSANKSHGFTPPTIEEVISYCKERNNSVDPQKWYDFYSAKGWMIGKNKMKDWKAAVRTWEKNDKPNNNVGGPKYEDLTGIGLEE
jgi:hypothetical protein